MNPMNHDIRSYYRKYQTGETVLDGIVTPTYAVEGPYRLAFRNGPGGKRAGNGQRSIGEEGYTDAMETYYVIAHNIHCFKSLDILCSDDKGETELYRVETAKDYPTEQQLWVRRI